MANQEQSKSVSWKKTSGTFILRRKNGVQETISAGQVFQALPEEVPMAFRDTIKPVDTMELEAKANSPLDVADPGYHVEPRGKLPGRFNVADGHGKVVNEQPLTAAEAQDLIDSLEK